MFIEKVSPSPQFTREACELCARAIKSVQSRAAQEVHGGLLSLVSFAGEPDAVTASDCDDLVRICRFLIEHKDPWISEAALQLLSVLARLDGAKAKDIEVVLSNLWDDERVTTGTIVSLVPIMQHFPELFSGQARNLVGFLRRLSDRPFFSFVEAFARFVPVEFEGRLDEVADLVASSLISPDFVSAIAPLFHDVKNFWNCICLQLGEAVLGKLRSGSSETRSILSLLILCPKFPTFLRDELFSVVHPLRVADDPLLRELAPAALLSLFDDIFSPSYHRLLQDILRLVVSESVSSVRLAILRSIRPPYSPFLLFPDSITVFAMLVNDESFAVRRAAVAVLGELCKMNPSMILPIFRRIMLDTLFISHASPLLKLQSQTSGCLALIIRSAEPILPIYIPMFFQVGMSYLSAKFPEIEPPTSSRQTYFEQSYSTLTAVNYIETIALLCQKDESSLKKYHIDITKLFLTILNKKPHKHVALAVLNAFLIIIDYVGRSILDQFPHLLQTLFNLGSNSMSTKVHSAIFRVYGYFGAKQPVLSYDIDIESTSDKPASLWDSLGFSEFQDSDWILSQVVPALLSVLSDENESSFHYQALTILSEWPAQSSSVVSHLFDQFINHLLRATVSAGDGEKEGHLELLQKMLPVHSQALKPFAGDFSYLITHLMNNSLLRQARDLTSLVAEHIGDAFAPHLPKIIPLFLETLFDTELTQPKLAESVLHALTALSTFATDYIFIIFRQMVDIVFNPMLKGSVVLAALKALRALVRKYNCSSYSSLLLRSCFECFSSREEDIRVAAAELLVELSVSPGSQFDGYQDRAIEQLKTAELFSERVRRAFESPASEIDSPTPTRLANELPNGPEMFDERPLIEAANCKTSYSAGQWKDWSRVFVLATIRASPSKMIRDSHNIAEKSNTLASRLFHPSFHLCWSKLSEQGKKAICDSLNRALTNEAIPNPVMTTIVSLVEFIERTGQHLPIPYLLLRTAAQRVGQFSFALYCEQCNPAKTSNSDAQLIYAQLGLDDDARGLAKQPSKLRNLNIDPKLTKLLGDWAPDVRLFQKNDVSNELIPCLGLWSMINDTQKIINTYPDFEKLPAAVKQQCAHLYAGAFARHKDWSHYDEVIKYSPTDSVESIIVQILATKDRTHDFQECERLLSRGFKALGADAGPLFAHGFSSLVPFFIQAKQLLELQLFANNKQHHWKKRMKRKRTNRLTLQQMYPLLGMRMQLCEPTDAMRMKSFLKLLRLSRDAGEYEFHDRVLKLCYPNFHVDVTDPRVVYGYSVSLYRRGQTQDGMEHLKHLVNNNLLPCTHPLLDCALPRLARWIIRSDSRAPDAELLRESARICQQANEDNRKARLLYAWTQIKLYNLKEGDRQRHAMEAIKGLVHCVIQRPNSFCEMMQLFSIVFRAGKYFQNFEIIEKQLRRLDLVRWLDLIPQLFAQLAHRYPPLAKFARNTVVAQLNRHHHAVIFPLLFCCGFAQDTSEIGAQILEKFRQEHPQIVQNVHQIYMSLIAACHTKTERWHEILTEILEHFKHGNFREMKATFEKAFKDLQSETCDADIIFNRLYADGIGKFAPILRFFFVSKNKKHLDQIWPDFKSILAAMKLEIDSMSSIALRSVAPLLSECRNVDISVPGQYRHDKAVIRIARFSTFMDVFPSKQRPKRFAIHGTDDREFWYLLKGHEDLRLDQRVVQLFSLINSFMPPGIPKIITNFILPLSTSVGLIQWIPGSDTMFKLIREYRTSHGIPTDLEHRLCAARSIAKIELLRPIQRCELIKEVAKETPDTVLADVFWLKSPESETWLKRVGVFSKTSGVMGVVGYLLGIGDRHTSNIMVHHLSGSVIHVDFGDCFESAKHRVLFPELVPFRLTRFMRRAFGPSKDKGTFRKSCLNMIDMIRGRREGIMSVFEIFVHAPLVRSWAHGRRREGGDARRFVQEITERVSNKIKGVDFESERPLSEEDHVTKLIQAAKNKYHMAHLFPGWKPLW
jgi:FKBP12-rapamycin complex-associated protein